MTDTLHAHVDRESADCDGRISDSYIASFNDDEIAESKKEYNDFSDISFMNRVFCNEAGPYAVSQARIEITDAGFDYHEDTDEGYRNTSVRWCFGDCDTERTTHRDYSAEAMGY